MTEPYTTAIIVDASMHVPPETPAKPPHHLLLDTIELPGAKISPKGLVLVVGPNSSGKTQLLKDVHAVLTGQSRELVVAKEIPLKKSESADAILTALIEEGHLKIEKDSNGNEYIKQTTPALGGLDFKSHNVPINEARNFWNRWQETTKARSIEQVSFLLPIASPTTQFLLLALLFSRRHLAVWA